MTVTGSPDAGAHVVVTSRRKDLERAADLPLRRGARLGPPSSRRSSTSRGSPPRTTASSTRSAFPPTRASRSTRRAARSRSPACAATAKLDTSGGSIHVNDLVGDLDGNTSGGSIDLTDVKGQIRVETSGGGIDGRNLDGAVHAESSGGSIELQKVTGDIDAETSGGGIRIVDAGGHIRADTSGGRIEASFTKGNSKGGTLETSGGGIEVSRRSGRRPLDPGVRHLGQDRPAAPRPGRDLARPASRAASARAATRCASTRAGAPCGSRACRTPVASFGRDPETAAHAGQRSHSGSRSSRRKSLRNARNFLPFQTRSKGASNTFPMSSVMQGYSRPIGSTNA